ncbi:MAG: 2-oxoacid:ferredoxin oxidoreductase subunit beta, partial [Gammaproteobacteria bacterium]|nr:2-oxoacid:ferredoxin oxidoreductase subunit beta [Gammaproteobacteria bacterium]
KKIAEDYDPSDRIRALEYLHRHEQAGEIVTGLLYMDPKPREMHQMLATTATPLNSLVEGDLCPDASLLEQINTAHR